MNLDELSLTPSQRAELEHVEPALVDAWLVAVDHAQGIHSPVGWFLAGVRSGAFPGATSDNERGNAIRLAERWVRNAGLYEPDEPSLVDALFGEHGRLRAHAGDELLVERMLGLWRHEQPRAERAQVEQLERAGRWRTAHQAIAQAVHAPYAHAPQPLSQSQVASTQADTQSADIDADADIVW